MGGRVGVESQPGQGSRFWIELPIIPEHEWVQSKTLFCL
jgi:signal transduction histidine kinase